MSEDKGKKEKKHISRRDFMKTAAFFTIAAYPAFGLALNAFQVAPEIENPLEHYPDRDWEKVYRDMYSSDSSFFFTCTPNDTHNCYLKAYVKNGIITRIGPSQRYRDATDLYSTKSSARWDPRICNKGIAITGRFYGEQRVKYPVVRKGYKEWIEKGMPRNDNGKPPEKYFRRGEDEWIRLSWDEAFALVARSMIDIAGTYSGDSGAKLLTDQGYDAKMIKKMNGAGTLAMKFRGGMPLLGIIKLFGLYRMANSMALLDSHIRKTGPDEAIGGMGFDNYSWHTDLPPGHPMVTGQQTIDFDLVNVEYTNVILLWGINWICTKMPDAHWLSEARLKGKKVITITTDYNATASKADEVVIIRPGTDSALALGIAAEVIRQGLYDKDFVRNYTDLPFLVRVDTGQFIKASEVIEGYRNKELKRTKTIKKGQKKPASFATNIGQPVVTEEMRNDWGDFTVWNSRKNSISAVSRDDTGEHMKKTGIVPVIDAEYEINLLSGEKVKVQTLFKLIKQHLEDTWDLKSTSKVTWAPVEAITSLARTLAANKEKVLFTVGMGPNQLFNADLKDRAIFLLASLTRNVGFFGGNVGSFAGNYRTALFNGMPQYIAEDPFNITTDPDEKVKIKKYFRMQSAHFYAHGDHPLKIHGHYFTGESHIPTPTKFFWFAASNSILGNAKGMYDIVMNMLRNGKIESLIVNEWWWSTSCEYADMVLPADSWGEYNVHDLTASVTNPFVMAMPLTGIKRIYNTKSDSEIYAGVSKKLSELTGDKRFAEYWHFIEEDKAKTYLQRIIDHCNTMKGYDINKLIRDAQDGIPALLMTRTYPKYIGYDQSIESKPWYNKTGRLEFLRDEQEFTDYGESIPIHREPVDSTFYEPNVIVAKPHPLIRPKTPEDYGWSSDDLSPDTRQVRNVIYTPKEFLKTKHPLTKLGYGHIFLTPKFRHSVHTFGVDTEILSIFFGPFGDMHRKDKRKPWINEGFVEMNPDDAKELGFQDGDYVYMDPDPEDRPFRGWQDKPADYKIARCMLRVRYMPNLPKGVTRSWFNMCMATHGSVKGHETSKDALAKNPDTNYQAMFRYGGHQSATRSWLRPTLLTDTLVRKNLMGQNIDVGFMPDVHCANGAPRESFVKFTKAEDGRWRPVVLGFRVGNENDDMKKYLKGEFVTKRGGI